MVNWKKFLMQLRGGKGEKEVEIMGEKFENEVYNEKYQHVVVSEENGKNTRGNRRDNV